MDNSGQKDYWDGEGGDKWGRLSGLLDTMLAPFNAEIIKHAKIVDGANIADIGCGTGLLTAQAAASAADAVATGIDLSRNLVAMAQQQNAGPNVAFLAADATAHRPDIPYTNLISRFGVMFFADPVEAFRRLRAIMAPQGHLSFACWQGLLSNDWAAVPMLAALPLLPEPPQPPAEGTPGPFAFADPDRVENILKEAGWQDVTISPFTTTLTLPGTNLDETVDFALDLGPLAALIREKELDPTPFREAVKNVLAEKQNDDGTVNLPAAIWLVTARA